MKGSLSPMKSLWSSISLMSLGIALAHCGPSGSNQPDGGSPDGSMTPTDGSMGGSDAGRDAAAPSRAGLECMDDSMCNGLTCDTEVVGGACTGTCMNGTPASEAMQCGGAGSTCLTAGDGAEAESFCTKRCTAGTMNSGCRAGFVCTGFWASHMGGTPDTPGCVPFCANDMQCRSGQRCNPRNGECSMTGPNPMGLPDGAPCRLPAMGQPDPCRGSCFTVVDSGTMGICGSIIDLARVRECPEDPMNIEPLAPPSGDNLAFCLFRNCSATQCCSGGTVCEGEDGTGFCTIDDPMTPNIACEAGADAGAPSDASAPSDAASGG